MRVLLDTHTLLWWLSGEPLGEAARAAISEPANEVHVSAASVWEATIKSALGRLELSVDLVEQIERNDFAELPIAARHATAAAALPPHHRDPFDRMLVAQAQLEGLAIVTRDRRLSLYDVALIAA